MDYKAMERIPVDPRVIDKIQRSPQMMREQGGQVMAGWGGGRQYQQLARLPVEQRICYAAILDGTTDQDQIGIVTGLSAERVTKGLEGLQKAGLVQIETSEAIT